MFAAALGAAAACSEQTEPTATSEGVDEPAVGVRTIVASLSCEADVVARRVSCARHDLAPGILGPRFLIVGGQGTFVDLISFNVQYDGTSLFQADVRVRNRLGDVAGVGQQLGTPDQTQITGVRVFFHTGPNVTSGVGMVTVSNADGTATYTAPNQPYHEYNEVLPPFLTSATKTWEWNVPNSVNTFSFEVFVEADVPHPNGYVLVSPANALLNPTQQVALSASIRDEVNRVQAGGVTWTSMDPTIATVNSSGVVTAQAGGIVDIVASTGGPEDDGIARITVPRSGYSIDLHFLSAISASQAQIFQDAKTRWESHLTADLADIFVSSNGLPFCLDGPVNEYVDDVAINVIVAPIDGVGMILGQAGPCVIRSISGTPAFGIMQFDVADFNNLESQGRLDETVLHEMAHVLGFGSLWSGLLLGGGTADPRFNGSNAFAAYQGVGGTGTTGVPVEGTGGPGTRDKHWREDMCSTCETADFFGYELMTGFLGTGTTPLSVVSIDHFLDIGYPTVNNTGADPFTLNTSLVALREPGTVIRLVDDVWKGPIYSVNEDGTLTIAVPDRR